MPRIAKDRRAGALIIAAFMAALALAAALQFQSTEQLSEAQHSTMRTALANSMRQFEQEFARELSYLLSVFRPDPIAASDGKWERYLERYDEWYQGSDYAPLVSRVLLYLTPADSAPGLYELQPDEWRLAAAAWKENQRPIKRQIEILNERRVHLRSRDGRMFSWTLFLREKSFILPLNFIVGRGPDRIVQAGYLLIELDPAYLTEQMIPQMAARYFSGPNGEELYQTAVVEEGGAGFLYRSHDFIGEEWLTAPDLRGSLLMARRNNPSRGGGGSKGFLNASGAIPSLRRDPREREPDVEKSRRGSTLLGGGERPPMFLGRSAVFLAESGRNLRWVVAAKHIAGSLDAAVQLQRRRNLGVGLGVLLLLGAAMAMVVVSSRRAKRLADMQMEFVAGISHELRTPLTVIRTAGDNLASGLVGSGSKTLEYGRLIRDQGLRLSEMVEQTLRFATLQSGKRKFKIEAVDAAQVIAETLADARPVIDQADFELRQVVESDLPQVRADRKALRQSLENLISNAVKYGAASRSIEVEAVDVGVNRSREVQIRVRDRGIGMAPQEMKSIFEAFYRGAAAETQIEGSGLGLKLARDMVRGMGGDLTAESELGRGSTFTIHLPLAESVQS